MSINEDREKIIKALKVAYLYGEKQTNKRKAPINEIISWCGYKYLPKPIEHALYASYKAGIHVRNFSKNHNKLNKGE